MQGQFIHNLSTKGKPMTEKLGQGKKTRTGQEKVEIVARVVLPIPVREISKLAKRYPGCDFYFATGDPKEIWIVKAQRANQ